MGFSLGGGAPATQHKLQGGWSAVPREPSTSHRSASAPHRALRSLPGPWSKMRPADGLFLANRAAPPAATPVRSCAVNRQIRRLVLLGRSGSQTTGLRTPSPKMCQTCAFTATVLGEGRSSAMRPVNEPRGERVVDVEAALPCAVHARARRVPHHPAPRGEEASC